MCTYSRRHPGRWIVTERLGTRNGRSAESAPVEGSISSIVNMRLGIRYTVRLVVRRYENLPRSTNCEIQARSRSFSGICKQWEQLRSCRLEDFNTTVVGTYERHCICHIVFGLDWNVVYFRWYADSGSTGHLVGHIELFEEQDGLGNVGDFIVWTKDTGLEKCNWRITGFEINKPASGSVVELLVCRVCI